MDEQLLLRLFLQYFPEIRQAIENLFASRDDTADNIARILAMRTPAEIEAAVAAGELPEPWATYRKDAAALKAFGDGLYRAIQMQAMADPESVTDDDLRATEAAHNGLVEAHGDIVDAIEGQDEADYQDAQSRLNEAVGELFSIKVRVCPVLNDEGDDE